MSAPTLTLAPELVAVTEGTPVPSPSLPWSTPIAGLSDELRLDLRYVMSLHRYPDGSLRCPGCHTKHHGEARAPWIRPLRPMLPLGSEERCQDCQGRTYAPTAADAHHLDQYRTRTGRYDR